MKDTSLIPKAKDDLDSVTRLSAYVTAHGHDARVLELLPELLQWTLDPHWPVAQPLGELIAKGGAVVIAPLETALRELEKDESGLYGLLVHVVKALPSAQKAQLRPRLEQLHASCQKGELPNTDTEELEALLQECLSS